MNLKSTLSIVALVSSLSVALPAMAEQSGQSAGSKAPQFTALDGNGDGRISKKEAKKDRTLSREWRYTDKNGDGALDASEFSAYESRKAEAGKEIPSQE